MSRSPKQFFTADLHFDHDGILEHCRRPFATVEEMNEALLDGINSLLPRGAVLWVLGDFAWRRAKDPQRFIELRSKIRCKDVRFLPGNHDALVLQRLRKIDGKKFSIWDGVTETHVPDPAWNGRKGRPAVLCHYPLLTWNRQHHGSLHLHGHSHGGVPLGQGRLDVGVDVAALAFGEYRPFSEEEVLIYCWKEERATRRPCHLPMLPRIREPEV